MQIKDILSELEVFAGHFPRTALKQAISQQEAITPELLAILEKYKNNLEALRSDSAYLLNAYALFLLSQFREKQAYPLVVELFSAPEEIIEDTIGFIATEYLQRILASICHGDLEPIEQLIENTEISGWTRTSALESLTVLVVQNVIPKEQVIPYFKELFDRFLEAKDDFMLTYLVVESIDIYAIELKPYIDRAYELGLVDTMMITKDEIDRDFALGEEVTVERLQGSRLYMLIEDAITELKGWAFFSEPNKTLPPPKPFSSSSKKTLNSGFSSPFIAEKSEKKSKQKQQKQARRKNRSKKKK
ncbi:DUF1186 domain-containing protein [Baaleninema simplex]|uniref:DUF1186 domain-containing protein n=1 Tax=Baaleninema simplex TaxID=2862350 RepID=UPI00034BFB6B|nr:DUF1186 domain-containing protein [Baaleninema simplex]